MKRILFECDVCKSQNQSIFETKISVQRLILGNGEHLDHAATPIEFSAQTCCLECLQKAVAVKAGHIMAKVEVNKEPKEINLAVPANE